MNETPQDPNNPSNGLHPNLAAIAATYDNIVAQVQAKRLSPKDARAQVQALEARDDFGIRWSIDPESGQFVRKTAFGDVEYDTPPASGVATPTGFTYSTDKRDDDPRIRMSTAAAGTPASPLADAHNSQQESLKNFKDNQKLGEYVSRIPTFGWVAILAVSAVALFFLLK